MICLNVNCKYHDEENECVSPYLVLDEKGKCESFEKSFKYYLFHLTDVMSSNFITGIDLQNDLDIRYSIYYLMKCIPLEFAVDQVRGMIIFRDSKRDKKLLHREDILDMIKNDMDREKLEECVLEFMNNGLPNPDQDEEATPKKEVYREYGWLSPSGNYIEAEFGDHEQVAWEIIESCRWGEEFSVWKSETESGRFYLARDFLCMMKGYALIHDPTGMRGYLVTNSKPLTKKQKEFLYDFFMDLGDRFRAEEYLED